MKVVNLETISSMQSWYKIWLLNGCNCGRAKPSLLKIQTRAYKSFSSRRTRRESFTLTNSLEFGKACEDLSWNRCASTPHRSETHGFASRAVRKIKEGTSAVLLPSGLDAKWWAGFMECYCYLRNIQDLLSGGKTPRERRFGEPFLKNIYISRLVHWLSITLSLRKTSQESINFERKFYLDCSSDTLSTRGEFGRVTY